MSKTAEKIAKHLTGLGWGDYLYYFYPATNVPQSGASLVEEIDRALENKTVFTPTLSLRARL